ncbi:MAG: helix-turn-helix transcriptional regulator [Tyzzerella sp.]|nr:helix-turn-helix transcriptional regulator [Tyzzerella sp.]
MKILYKQPEFPKYQTGLSVFGIKTCCFKSLAALRDSKRILLKSHHHTDFEIHFITEGYQIYKVGETDYKLEKGNYIIISPGVQHRATKASAHMKKYGITFNLKTDALTDCFVGKADERFNANISFIENETTQKKEISELLTENCILEIIVTVLRAAGYRENAVVDCDDENNTLSIAKQYIKDNTERSIKVSDVAKYCYLSTKQLTRIFNQYEGISPGDYIKNMRIKAIEKLLLEESMSLKSISDKMNFSNESYFNTFFKKHSGMSPGKYRNMFGK